MNRSSSRITQRLANASPRAFSAYCIVAAFGAYFCAFAFRKPVTAAVFDDQALGGVAYKTLLIAAQVAGYTLAKFLGIKFVSEMPASRRAVGILAMIGIAEGALLLFAITPPPYNFVMLFLNGFPLGLVFGLVLAYLEGRALTEALAAGLCASFILAGGVVKSVGQALIQYGGVSEYWMPFVAGLIFVGPLLAFVWMLDQIPPPSRADVEQRSERAPMTRQDRRAFFVRHAVGLTCLLAMYVALTIVRGVRDDFAVEIWRDLGAAAQPAVFAKIEMLVTLGILVVSGATVGIRGNRAALLASLGVSGMGFALVLLTLGGQRLGALSPFAFMVGSGLGLYLPYVAFHTTIFERLIATFRERANVGYLMYLADAVGYTGYIGVMVFRGAAAETLNFLGFYMATAVAVAAFSLAATLFLIAYYYQVAPAEAPKTPKKLLHEGAGS